MIIDTHANLHNEAYADDMHEVLKRARQADIAGIVNICCQQDEFANALSLTKGKHGLPMWCTIGIHPHYAAKHGDLPLDWLLEGAAHPNVIGIGETGLDYHYDYSPRDAQMNNLDLHMQACRITGLPLVLHTREADEDMHAFLQTEHQKGPFDFILHSYTSGEKLAKLAASLGGFFSVNGISTFKNATQVRDIIEKIMPCDKIMLETDCPYLAPVPFRGKRNEPSYLLPVRDQLAKIKDWTIEETQTRTTNAFFTLFPKANQK